MAQIAQAEVALLAKFPNVKASIENALTPAVEGIDRAATQAGGRFQSKVASAFKTTALVGGAAIGSLGAAVGGIAVHGGIARALNIENAKAKLAGLGHSTQGVQAIMDSALASVKGTAYGLGDAASVAAGLSAAGLQAGSDLDGALKSVADVAQITGRSLTDVGNIFGSVAARGKLQGDDLLQLTSSGLPVLKLLGEHLGKTSEEVSDMVSRGEIDFATFQAAMEEGIGGAAQNAGTTFTGAWANVKAALSRIGEQLATPILNALRDLFNNAIPIVDAVAAALEPAFDFVKDAIGRASNAVGDFIQRFNDAGGIASVDWLQPLIGGFGDLFEGIWNAAQTIYPFLEGIFTVVGGAFEAVMPVISSVVGGIGSFLGMLLSNQALVQFLVIAGGLALGLAGAVKALGVAAQITQLPLKLMAAAQAALNAVMAANPITLIIIAIAALVAAIVVAWQHSETFRNIVMAAWEGIKTAVGAVVDWFMTYVWPILSLYLEGMKMGFQLLWQFLMAVWEGIKTTIGGAIEFVWNIISTVVQNIFNWWSSVWDSVSTVVSVVWALIKNTVSNAISNVRDTVVNIMTAVRDTILNVMTSVRDTISNGIETVKSLWSAGWEAVKSFLSSAWDSMKNAASNGIGGVIDLVSSIPGKILSAIGDLGSLLYNAGSSVISGLIDGIRSCFGWVRDTLGSLTSMLPDWKGPVEVDKRILYNSGVLVMSGFQRGLEDQYDSIRRTLSDFTYSMNRPAPTPVSEYVNPANDLTGLELSGRLDLGGDGIARIVDGRVERSLRSQTRRLTTVR